MSGRSAPEKLLHTVLEHSDGFAPDSAAFNKYVEISLQTGYPNANYFYKVFKRHVEITLGDFKSLLKQLQ